MGLQLRCSATSQHPAPGDPRGPVEARHVGLSLTAAEILSPRSAAAVAAGADLLRASSQRAVHVRVIPAREKYATLNDAAGAAALVPYSAT